MNHLDQATHHLLASREVGNDSIAQGANGADIVVCLLIHHLGFLAHGNHLVGAAVQSHNRRLVNNNLIITDDDGVGGAEIHCNLLNKRKKSHVLC